MNNDDDFLSKLTIDEILLGEYDVHYSPPDERGFTNQKILLGGLKLFDGEYTFKSGFIETEIPDYLYRELPFLYSPAGMYDIQLSPEFSKDIIVEDINFGDNESVKIGNLRIMSVDGVKIGTFQIYLYKETKCITLEAFESGLFFWSIIKSGVSK
ncbi:MAG: hypothetical protein JXB38_00935 [Anaerolineales bacterium]|nr:hypothetical protein [Anaerolineales bacterium]